MFWAREIEQVGTRLDRLFAGFDRLPASRAQDIAVAGDGTMSTLKGAEVNRVLRVDRTLGSSKVYRECRRLARVLRGPLAGGAALWLTWNDSSRSRSLSGRLGARLVAIDLAFPQFLRQPICALLTVWRLAAARPRLVFVQYSWLLLVIVAAYRAAMPVGVTIVCDCHNKALRRQVVGVLGRVFDRLKSWSFGHVRRVIVSNEAMRGLARTFAPSVTVMPDPIPDLSGPVSDAGETDVVVICSFAEDEPLDDLLGAARMLPERQFRLTGRAPKGMLPQVLPPNVKHSGFIPQREYRDLLQRASVVVALTTDPLALQCAASEAIAAARPLVISDSVVARAHFRGAAVYVANESGAIAQAIRTADADASRLVEAAVQLCALLEAESSASVAILQADLA